MSKATTPVPTYEAPLDYESLNKFLAGTMARAAREEIKVEYSDTIAKQADKIIKNNLTKLMYDKMKGNEGTIAFFEPSDKQVLIG